MLQLFKGAGLLFIWLRTKPTLRIATHLSQDGHLSSSAKCLQSVESSVVSCAVGATQVNTAVTQIGGRGRRAANLITRQTKFLPSSANKLVFIAQFFEFCFFMRLRSALGASKLSNKHNRVISGSGSTYSAHA